MRFLYFFFFFRGSFLPVWIRMGSPDPDPESLLNPDPIGIRNTVFREARSGFL
jgi:hypothetical protein